MFDELREKGIDIEDAVNRCMGNKALYEKLLKKFDSAVNDAAVAKSFSNDDFQAAFEGAHTLKGITGNFSMTPLYEGYSEVVRLLRANENDQARKVYESIVPVENEIIEIISRYK